jgi:predicted amidohydrolase
MKTKTCVAALVVGLISVAIGTSSQAGPPAGRASKAGGPPRKVVVGTVILPLYSAHPTLDEQLKRLGGLVDEMAKEAAEKYPGKGLDLAIFNENAVTPQHGKPLEIAVPLDGPVRETFSALARKHRTYIVAPLCLLENGPKGTFTSNAAVLFDRKGEVAGIYRKVHPVALLGTSVLEGGITPGAEFPVFDCDFGKLGIQICWDIVYDDGWDILAQKGAEIIAWPSASPSTVQPASRAGSHRYYIVSSTWRDNATIFEPTGFIAAQVEGSQKGERILVHQLDLSYAVLGWSAPLHDGKVLSEKFGDRVGYHYGHSEDVGLFWSNDPQMSIGEMIRSFGLEEIDAQIERNRRLQDASRGAPVPQP